MRCRRAEGEGSRETARPREEARTVEEAPVEAAAEEVPEAVAEDPVPERAGRRGGAGACREAEPEPEAEPSLSRRPTPEPEAGAEPEPVAEAEPEPGRGGSPSPSRSLSPRRRPSRWRPRMGPAGSRGAAPAEAPPAPVAKPKRKRVPRAERRQRSKPSACGLGRAQADHAPPEARGGARPKAGAPRRRRLRRDGQDDRRPRRDAQGSSSLQEDRPPLVQLPRARRDEPGEGRRSASASSRRGRSRRRRTGGWPRSSRSRSDPAGDTSPRGRQHGRPELLCIRVMGGSHRRYARVATSSSVP